MRSIRISID